MTTKRVVYTKPDGTVSVLRPMDEAVDRRIAGGMTEDEAIADIQAKDVPPGSTDVIVTEFANLPTDRLFRNDWRRVGAGLPTVGMSVARRRHAQRIAKARRRALVILGEREDELRMSGRTTAADAVATDITTITNINRTTISTQISDASTPSQLKVVWPAVLDEFRPF